MSMLHKILCVLADGEWHDEGEIVQRLRHTVDPSQAIRRMADSANHDRARKRARAIVRTLPQIRKPDVEASLSDIDLTDAIRKVILTSLHVMLRHLKSNEPMVERLGYQSNGAPASIIPEANTRAYNEIVRRHDKSTLADRWRLAEAGRRRMLGNAQMCGKMARELRTNLMIRGRLL